MAVATIPALFLFAAGGFGQDTVADAMQTYRQELEQNPRNALAHFRLGELFFDQQNFQSAANEFSEAIKGEPHAKAIDTWAHIELGEIFDITGQRDRAIGEYRKAMGSGDDSEGAQAVVAGLLAEGAKPEQALTHHILGHYNFAEPAKPLVEVPAGYSKEARLAEIEGTLTFVATLAADGSVSDLRLLKSLGLGLDESAKAAAQRWSFELAKTVDASLPPSSLINFDFLLPEKQSRWHLLRVAFDTPEGTARPHFVKTSYPAGEGISPEAFDDARILSVLGRQAVATISFDVDETGRPLRFQIERPTQRVWGEQAISVVKKWQFSAGNRDGLPMSVHCTVDLVWGEKRFTKDSLVRADQEFQTASLVASVP